PPADKSDLVRRDAGCRRVLDEALRTEAPEVAGEIEVAREDLREAPAERAARVAAEILERHDGDRKRLAARAEDLPGDDRACRRGEHERGDQYELRDQLRHPAPRPPVSSEWNSITNSR